MEYQVVDMMKDFCELIMVDVKCLLNKNLKEFGKEIARSVEASIDEALNSLISHTM